MQPGTRHAHRDHRHGGRPATRRRRQPALHVRRQEGPSEPAPRVLSRNGLDNGRLYVFRSIDPARNSERTFTGGSIEGEWVEIPNAGSSTDDAARGGERRRRRDDASFVPRTAAFNPRNRNDLLLRHDRILERSRRRRQRARPALLAAAASGERAQAGDAHDRLQRRHVIAEGGDIAISPDNIDASRRLPDDQRGRHHGEPRGHGLEGPRRLDLALRPERNGRAVLTSRRPPGSRSSTRPVATACRSARASGRRAASSTTSGDLRRGHLVVRCPGPPAHDRSRRPDGDRRGRAAVPDAASRLGRGFEARPRYSKARLSPGGLSAFWERSRQT